MKPILYVRLKKRVVTKPNTWLYVKDVCQLSSTEPIAELLHLPVLKTSLSTGNYTVIELLQIIQLIEQQAPHFDIRNVGGVHTIVEVQTTSRIPKKFFVVLVWIFLFLGSGLAIMNFHADVNMQEVHERIYYLVTGQKMQHPLLMEIPYSLGIGLGMILFFNHLFKRRFNEEPSPMELEMFMYQETIDQYVIDSEKQQAKVDSS